MLSLPVEAPLTILVEGDLAETAPLGTLRARLADSSTFDARDSNIGSTVPVVYATDPVEGAPIDVLAPADAIVTARLPISWPRTSAKSSS